MNSTKSTSADCLLASDMMSQHTAVNRSRQPGRPRGSSLAGGTKIEGRAARFLQSGAIIAPQLEVLF